MLPYEVHGSIMHPLTMKVVKNENKVLWPVIWLGTSNSDPVTIIDQSLFSICAEQVQRTNKLVAPITVIKYITLIGL